MGNVDIFGRDSMVGEPFSADDTELVFKGAKAQTMVVQQLSIAYQQAITRLWEIGSTKQYFVAGHQQGSANMARVVGPQAIASDFMTQYGDVCKIYENHITFIVKGDCSTVGGRLHVTGVVITQVAYTVKAQDMVVSESVDMLLVKVEAT